MAKLYLEPVPSQPTLSPSAINNQSGLVAQDAITNAINSASVQVAKENNISIPQANAIVQSEVNKTFTDPNYVPDIPTALVSSLNAYKASLNAQNEFAKEFVANQASSATLPTTPSANTLANLGGTGKVADVSKINTQGGLATTGTQALTTGDVNKIATTPAATSSPNIINTGSIPALTTADLASWGKSLPQGITADQLKTALEGQQTALTSQNANFLKDWNTSADALKNSILTGVDTKNQQFGTQATQGFMDAFKNFQIPTNQQTGVNLGNYNDNRNAAADQWWSQYVTGRR